MGRMQATCPSCAQVPRWLVNLVQDRLSWVSKCKRRGNARNGDCVVSQSQIGAQTGPWDWISWELVVHGSVESGVRTQIWRVRWTLSPAFVIRSELLRVLCLVYKPLFNGFRLEGGKWVCWDVCVCVGRLFVTSLILWFSQKLNVVNKNLICVRELKGGFACSLITCMHCLARWKYGGELVHGGLGGRAVRNDALELLAHGAWRGGQCEMCSLQRAPLSDRTLPLC